MDINNLRGLQAEGFTESTEDFEENIFKKAGNIEQIRAVIKTYFRKMDSINFDNSSYGLKHIVEKDLGFYVTNGELIYAMALENFTIEKGSVNCFFNVSKVGIKLLKNANEISETLKIPAFYNDKDYLTRKKSFLKYKYTFNSLIDCRFAKNIKLKRYVYSTIALELREDADTVMGWMNIFNSDDSVIPEAKLKQLSEIFNLKGDEMYNPKVK